MAMYWVIERNIFDTTCLVRGIHASKRIAQGQADAENATIRNDQERVIVVTNHEFNQKWRKGASV